MIFCKNLTIFYVVAQLFCKNLIIYYVCEGPFCKNLVIYNVFVTKPFRGAGGRTWCRVIGRALGEGWVTPGAS